MLQTALPLGRFVSFQGAVLKERSVRMKQNLKMDES